jgi:hypothetical protein
MIRLSSQHQSLLPARRAGRRLFAAVGLLCAFALVGTLSTEAASQSPDGYQVIVNAKNPTTSVNRELVTDIFLKRTTSWEGAGGALPVDLRLDSGVRAAFSRSVLKRSLAAVRSYWTQRIFSGREVPPPELESEAAVVRFVASHPGGVGYVSPGPPAPGVKRLELR